MASSNSLELNVILIPAVIGGNVISFPVSKSLITSSTRALAPLREALFYPLTQ